MSATSPVVGRRCATDGNDRHTEVSTTPEATDPGVGAATLFAAGEQLDRRCVIVCVGIFLFAFFLVFWTGLNRADVKTLGCLCSSCVALASCIYAGLWRPSAYSPKTAFFARLGVVVFSCISIVLLHHTTMKALFVHRRGLWDHFLLDRDVWFLGRFFPEGQVSLHIDKMSSINPNLRALKVLTEGLLIAYHMQPFWSFLLIFTYYLDYLIPSSWTLRAFFSRRHSLSPWQHSRARWSRLQAVLVGWLVIGLICYILNFVFAASGPGVYLMRRYKIHSLDGLDWWGSYLRDTIASTGLLSFAFGSFPSVQCSLTLYASLAASTFGSETMTWIYTYGAFFGAFGAVFLRVHYFTDILASLAVALVGRWVAMHSTSFVNAVTQGMKSEEESSHTKNT